MKRLLGLLLFLPLLPVGASAQPAECDGNFHLVHTLSGVYMLDIDFSNPNDGWSVGYEVPASSQNEQPVVVRFDDQSFESTTLPAADGGGGALLAVDALSPSDVFAVGYRYPNFESTETLITHWDGNEWTEMPSPSPGAFASLEDVVVIAPDDVWAVGGLNRRMGFDPLVLHYNGETWSRVGVPTFANRVDGLLTVDAADENNIYAGGFKGSQHPLLLYFNGETWTREPVGKLSDKNSLFQSVDAVASDDVWGVGIRLAAHLTPSGWTATDIPNVRGAEWLQGVAAEAGEAWAVGFRFRNEDVYTLALHWDGSSWSRVTFEGGKRGQVEAVTLDSSGAAWAIGINFNPETSQFEQVIEKACT